jgi:saccharopine dehydrogenase-like NADP-dependent oxidoreductase
MKKILLFGTGKVGALVGVLLAKRFEVHGFDIELPKENLGFESIAGDVKDIQLLEKLIPQYDAIVSCLPYYFNKAIVEITWKAGKHYFDLTEDVSTTKFIRALALQGSKGILAPQCGLAPGLIGIVGASLLKKFDKIRDIELRVGALPKYPNGLLGYSFTWSPAGVINEYLNDCEVIHNGVRKEVPALEGVETINIEGQEFEAFSTSGGLGTLCETLEGKVDTLNYKTIRYPGHCRLMRFLMYELILKDQRALLEKILTEAKPPVQEDVVYVYAVVEGWQQGSIKREEFYQAYSPKIINDKQWRAISWTTAASLVAVIEMVADGNLPTTGFLKQEDIDFADFLKTTTGQFFL